MPWPLQLRLLIRVKTLPIRGIAADQQIDNVEIHIPRSECAGAQLTRITGRSCWMPGGTEWDGSVSGVMK